MIGVMLNNPTYKRLLRHLLPFAACGLLAGCQVLQATFCRNEQGAMAMTQAADSSPDLPAAKETGGSTTSRVKALEEEISRPPQPGVTDQALFQLSMQHLQSNSREGYVKAHQLLNRLNKDYPGSNWNSLGQPVVELLDTVAEQRRQISTLKNQNQALSKENKELHQTIERLKSLDLELEKKSLR